MSLSPADELRALHEQYVWAANAAVEAGDLALADEVAEPWTDEALALLTAPR